MLVLPSPRVPTASSSCCVDPEAELSADGFLRVDIGCRCRRCVELSAEVAGSVTDGLAEVGDRGAAASGLLKQHDTVVMSMSGTKLTSRLRCVVVVRTADAGPRTTPIGACLQPRSVRDAHTIADLAERGVELSIGG